MPKFPEPPSTVSGELRDYLRQVTDAFNRLPTVSYFSGLTPNGTVVGGTGHFAINLGSSSTLSRVWINAAPPSQVTNQSWVILRVATP